MKKVRPLKMPHDRAVKALYEVLDNLFEIDRYWEDVPKVYGEAVAHMCRGVSLMKILRLTPKP